MPFFVINVMILSDINNSIEKWFKMITVVTPATNRIKIALVDGDLVFTKQLRHFLHRANPNFTVVATATQWSEVVKLSETAKPDVVIIDAVMGAGREGIEAIREIVRLSENPPKIIVLTESDAAEVIVDSFLAGAADYVYKNGYSNQLAGRILSALGVSPNPYQILARELYTKQQEIYFSKLSGAEKEVITLMVKGLSYQEISRKLNKEVQTVKNQAVKIFAKLSVKNRKEISEKFKA